MVHRVFRGSRGLATAAFVGQALGFVFLPLIARMYTPAQIGVFTVVTTVASVLGALGCLRMEMAIVTVGDNAAARDIRRMCYALLTFFCVGILFVVLILLLLPISSPLIGVDGNAWLMLPLLTFGVGATAVETSTALRGEVLSVLSVNRIERPLLTNLSQVAAPLLLPASGLLLTVASVASYVGTSVLMSRRLARRLPQLATAPSRRPGRMRELLIEHRALALLNGPNVLVDGVRNTGVLMVIGAYYGDAVLGQYSQAWRLLWIPVSLVSGVVSQVAFSRLARITGAARSKYFFRVMLALASVAIPAGLVLFAVAPGLFTWVLGERWELSGELARALVPWLVVNLVASPASNALIVAKRPGTLLGLSSIYAITTLGAAVFAGSLGWSAVQASWTISLAGASSLAVLLLVSASVIRTSSG